jgi:hypothetical protein
MLRNPQRILGKRNLVGSAGIITPDRHASNRKSCSERRNSIQNIWYYWTILVKQISRIILLLESVILKSKTIEEVKEYIDV